MRLLAEPVGWLYQKKKDINAGEFRHYLLWVLHTGSEKKRNTGPQCKSNGSSHSAHGSESKRDDLPVALELQIYTR